MRPFTSPFPVFYYHSKNNRGTRVHNTQSPYTYSLNPITLLKLLNATSKIASIHCRSINMMTDKTNHAISSSSPSSSSSAFSNCRQTAAGCSGKSDVALARRRRAELRRLKVAANGDDECLLKRRRFEKTDNEIINCDFGFPHYSCVVGRRREMEDAVSVELGFANPRLMKFDFYGVYDGHGGSKVAEACRDRLHKVLAAEMEVAGGGSTAEMDWEKMMVESFEKMDEEVNETDLVGSMGSTAIVAVVGDEEVVVANCGDSRAVLSRGGAAVPLSNDHKPDRPDELERIERSGGRVINWDCQRVLGVLATSRSIGDRQLSPYVIPKPEVIVHKREDKDEFMILASDGLWDVISNDLACHVVRKCLDGWRSPQTNDNRFRTKNVATILTELAMARGSKDNISVIVVNLKN